MPAEEKLREVKAILRSLLISSGREITIHQLNKNYQDEEGEYIPFRKFGYSTLEDFLNHISDTLRLHYNRNHELCARHVDTEKSAHISSLIARQKSKPKIHKGIAGFKTRPGFNNNYSKPSPNMRSQFRTRTSHQLLSTGRVSSSKFSGNSQSTSRYANPQSSTTTLQKSSISNNRPTLPTHLQSYHPPQSAVISQTYENKNSDPLPKKLERDIIINERTKIRLQMLLENHPEGIWCSELPDTYKSEYKIDLEYVDLGFNNITEFVAAFPDIFKVTQPQSTNRHMVLDARKSSSNLNNQHKVKTLASIYNYDDLIAKHPDPVPIKLVIYLYFKFIII